TSGRRESAFDPNRRAFTWTPKVEDLGDHEASFRVTDGEFTDNMTVCIRVVEKPLLLIAVSHDQAIKLFSLEGILVGGVDVKAPNESSRFIQPRDLVALPDGRIALNNGLSNPVLSIYDSQRDLWRHSTYPGLTTRSRIGMGGIANMGNELYVPSNRSETNRDRFGIVVFDASGNRSPQLVNSEVPNIDYADVAVHKDKFYGLDTVNKLIHVYDRQYSYLPHETIDLSAIEKEIYSFAFDSEGTIYGGTWDGWLLKISADGKELLQEVQIHQDDQKTPYIDHVIDIDILAPDEEEQERVVLGSAFGRVTLSNTELEEFFTFLPNTLQRGEAFVSFLTPVDDPSYIVSSVRAEASSSLHGFGAERSVDGLEHTLWAGDPNQTNRDKWTLTLTLPQEEFVTKLVMNQLFASGNQAFDAEVSTDGITWQPVHTASFSARRPGDFEKIEVRVEKLARYVRIAYIRAGNPTAMPIVREIEIHAADTGSGG
ncbi:MAG: discoidin domain-containing protein, partial [Bdellovibrionales bacterium]|nr:discoidin domain-containing protein [Bdellovibrionales bacterium]